MTRSYEDDLQDYIRRELGRGWIVTDEALVSRAEGTAGMLRLWHEDGHRVVYVKRENKRFTHHHDLAALVWSRHA